MKIYIAARYNRRFELVALAEELKTLGHEITARWIWGGEDHKPIQEAAAMDVEDVLRADCLVFIGEPQASKNCGGGRWFEFGLAYGAGKRCIAVLDMDSSIGGHAHLPLGHESVFTSLSKVQIIKSQEELKEVLGCDSEAKARGEVMNTEHINDLQVGGTHYRSAYPHWDWAIDMSLGPIEYAASKYISRWWKKHGPIKGVEDVEKAKHYVQKIKEAYRENRYPNGLSRIGENKDVAAKTVRFQDTNGMSMSEGLICLGLATWQTQSNLDEVLAMIDSIIRNPQMAAGGRGG